MYACKYSLQSSKYDQNMKNMTKLHFSVSQCAFTNFHMKMICNCHLISFCTGRSFSQCHMMIKVQYLKSVTSLLSNAGSSSHSVAPLPPRMPFILHMFKICHSAPALSFWNFLLLYHAIILTCSQRSLRDPVHHSSLLQLPPDRQLFLKLP